MSPVLGEEVVRQVATAIAAGYRLIDTAENYRNEEGVGEGIRASGVDRSVIFLDEQAQPGVAQRRRGAAGAGGQPRAAGDRLPRPVPDPLAEPRPGRYVDAVRGLEALREEGLVHAIGVSNFKPAHLRRVVEETGSPRRQPVQLSPYATRPDVRAFDDEYGIATESWSPLGASSTALREDARLGGIADRLDKTPTQVILRWHVQMGLVAIPKSTSPKHLAENIGVFDFELTDDDMAAIAELDRGDADLTDSDTFGH